MTRVLLIDDHRTAREGLRLALTRHGHAVATADSGEQGLARLRTFAAEVIVLDLTLPGMDGFDLCRHLRTEGDLPIIVLTARDDDIDVVAALEAGADDYVIQPVHSRIVEARIRAVLRRAARQPTRPTGREQHGALCIDRCSLSVGKSGRRVRLAPTEMRLLLTLSAEPARVHTRHQLLEAVWQHDFLGDSRLVDACVQRLRAKIEDDPHTPVYVQTVRGFGYRFGPVPA
ncbi:DNA-binding response regulator [Catellatospora methionotrophica]|uniref:DNA-binding response regulator n=1 Tax=Catellatospora methionotrophica TaxID=121620 RepID=A0A8J3LA40_9ACTN|nr:response regulator transcription factor [Catellatospora methionotrophica]GIG15217.1 DNA-binding response regulator [Catellatospora methionotrophica]